MSFCSLKIKTSDGKAFKIEEVRHDLTVLGLKQFCAGRCGVPALHQNLFLKGKQVSDDATLTEAGVIDNSTIFLTKSQSWGAELEKTPAGTVPCAGGCGSHGVSRTDNFCSKCFAKQTHVEREQIWNGIFAEGSECGEPMPSEREEPTGGPLAIGAPVRIHGLQSAKALNGRLGWIVKYVEETSRFSVKMKGEQGTKAIRGGNLRRLNHIAPLSASKVFTQSDKTRCWCCSKKCGLTGFSCRCGYIFCSLHRHAEDHQCDFDHKRLGQDLISKNNPKLDDSQQVLLQAI